MNNFMDYFFGPLSKDYCLYYYILSIIMAITFVILLVVFIHFTLTEEKKIKWTMIMSMFSTLFSIFMSYFVARLLYSMCSRSL